VTYLLDTNVWFLGLVSQAAIPEKILNILRGNNAPFGLSAISVWEIGKKAQNGKITVNQPLSEWLQTAVSSEIELLPLTAKVIATAVTLPEFPNRDPADELIVATAKVHDLTLLTTDRALRQYRHARIEYFKPLPEA
jgi:PIN domain nuclease of toxin-antitoxin system